MNHHTRLACKSRARVRDQLDSIQSEFHGLYEEAIDDINEHAAIDEDRAIYGDGAIEEFPSDVEEIDLLTILSDEYLVFDV